MGVVYPPRQRKFPKGCCQTEVLKLIDGTKIVGHVGNDIANRKVSIAFLGKRRPAIVGVTCILRSKGDERIGKLPFNVFKMVVSRR